MKTPSKLDQARAMREARYSVEPVRLAVSTEAIDRQMIREGMIEDPYRASPAVAALDDARAINDLPMEVRARVSAALVKARWRAPEGECASCDKRRAALNATMRKRRAAKP